MKIDEYARAVVYRRAYAMTQGALERDALGPHFPGGDPADLALLAARLDREVRSDSPYGETAREGILDAVEGRRPRW